MSDLTEPEHGTENPMPADEDPIVSLIEKPIDQMSNEDLDKHIEKLSEATNNPKALNRMITGKSRAKKKTSKRTSVEKAAFDNILDNL